MKTKLLPSISKQLIIVLISCLMTFSALTQASNTLPKNDVQISYTFQNPIISSIDIGGTVYDRVTMPDCSPAGSAGEPKIPSKGAYILLPPMSTISGIEITTGEKIRLGSGLVIEPTSEAIPISQVDNLPVPTPNEKIYQTNAPYPGALFTQIGVYGFRGYQILVLQLHPLQYNPVTGELFYYPHLTVSVSTKTTEIQSNLYRGFQKDQREVAQKVDNPEMVGEYNIKCAPRPAPLEQYDLLILTTSSLETGFVPLKDAHDATGVSTVIKTLTDVGASDLESIRNYIKDAYTNWGIEYVLIGGDNGVVNAPMLWVSGMDENVTYYEDTMPADLYFACLDGPFNYDGDDKWGEPHDGEGGGDVDLVAEVYVGRACVDSMTDVNNYVTKTVAYITRDQQDPYLKTVCLAAEYLGDYGIASYGSSYMNQLIDGCSDDGYTTVGIPSSEYSISTLYDTPSYSWSPSDMISVINNGVHIINHLGHASEDYNMKLYTYDVDSLSNPSSQTCFIYSQGCYSGAFDYTDCIAEHFTSKTSHAAFAGVWNARYGFFWSYSTDGDSQRLNRELWDAVFGENIAEIGRANHDSKEDNLAIITRSCIRWCYYQTNLFGDPALRITEGQPNQPPEQPDLPTGPTSGYVGIDYVYGTTANDPEGDDVYYQWNWGDEVSGWLGPYASNQTIEASHHWDVTGDYQISVKAKDSNDAESALSDPLTVHIVVAPQIEITSVRGGFGVSADVRNTGGVNISGVTWVIKLQGLVVYGQEKSGTILDLAPNGTQSISTGLVLGFGRIGIVITASDVQRNATAFLFGPIVINVRQTI